MRSAFLRRLWAVCLMLVMLTVSLSAPVSAAAGTYTYYKSHINAADKPLYNKLRKTWAACDSSVIETYSSNSAILSAGWWVLNDYPQYFWCNSYSTLTINGRYLFRMVSWRNAFKQKAIFNRRLSRVVSTLTKRCAGKTNAEKAVIIHDWVCNNCQYVDSSYDQTTYGVLVKKKAVCAGYARCYKLLCDKLGLKCICVNVYSNGVPHLLNYVRIGGKWYLVDCTNDDQELFPKPLRYFCLAGSSTSGAYLSYSKGVPLPALSVDDYPLPDREQNITFASKMDPELFLRLRYDTP